MGRVVRTVSEYVLKITKDQAKEIPMVDLAFEILRAANTPYYYRDLMKEIAKFKELSESQMMSVIAQVYTEINIDGRFACVGTNLWGLKRWYPVEKADDAVGGNAKRPRIINDEDDLDDEDLYVEEEDAFDSDVDRADDFDTIDEDNGEFFDEEEEEVVEGIAEVDAEEGMLEDELEDELEESEEDEADDFESYEADEDEEEEEK
jgi:DNA-directed RNA polymerase subunit delta